MAQSVPGLYLCSKGQREVGGLRDVARPLQGGAQRREGRSEGERNSPSLLLSMLQEKKDAHLHSPLTSTEGMPLASNEAHGLISTPCAKNGKCGE